LFSISSSVVSEVPEAEEEEDELELELDEQELELDEDDPPLAEAEAEGAALEACTVAEGSGAAAVGPSLSTWRSPCLERNAPKRVK
jgi:hypothetical protein